MYKPLLHTLAPQAVDVVLSRVDEAEVDEMWSFVGKKKNQRWLWHVIDHRSGQVLAYVCGRRQDGIFVQLKALLEPFGLKRSHTDHRGAYTRHLDPAEPSPGNRGIRRRSNVNM